MGVDPLFNCDHPSLAGVDQADGPDKVGRHVPVDPTPPARPTTDEEFAALPVVDLTEFDDRTEWLAWRKTKIGASDVAGIVGISRWASPYSVWVSKTVAGTDDEESEAMEAGRMLEPAISPWFTKRTGLYVAGHQRRVVHPDIAYAAATLDGEVYDHPLSGDEDIAGIPLGALEIKTTSDSPKTWEEDGIPPYYAAQGQWQMYVSGMERTWFAVLHGSWGLKLRIYLLERDDDDIALLAERVERFWTDHVMTGEPPPVDGHPATTDALRMIDVDPDAVVILSDEARRVAADLEDMKKTRKRIDERIDEATNVLRSELGAAEVGYDAPGDRKPRVSWKRQSASKLDAAALRSAMPITARKFTKSTTYRVLRTHPPKEKSHGRSRQ